MLKKATYLLFITYLFLTSITCLCQSKQADEIQTGYIDIGKCKLHYEMKGEGTPLIMIHAGMLNKEMWEPQFEEFANHFKVIIYDARYHGLSQCEPDTFSHYTDLYSLMEKLQIPKAVIMGESMGGYIAIDFAIAYPAKVIALIPVSPGLTGYEFKDKIWLESQAKMQNAQTIEEVVEYIQITWTDGPQRTPGQVDPLIRNKAKQMYIDCIKNMKPGIIEERLDPPAIDRLSSIDAPTLVIVGDLDVPGITDIADLIVKNVKGSRKITIKGAAHLVNMEKPAEFNKAVISFISGLEHR
jgi:3-oxoadipate enol-lactonase